MEIAVGKLATEMLSEWPRELLQHPWTDYFRVMRFDGLNDDHIQTIDYVVKYKVLDLLLRNAPIEELEEAYVAIRRLVPVELEERATEIVIRWRAFADLLNARIECIKNS